MRNDPVNVSRAMNRLTDESTAYCRETSHHLYSPSSRLL